MPDEDVLALRGRSWSRAANGTEAVVECYLSSCTD